MCGIVGIASKKPVSVKNKLLKCLKRLEYRGYDSVGYALATGHIKKAVGSVDNFIDSIENDFCAHLLISHTRWATHGGITEINAHPHFNDGRTIFVVHNGIIENYAELKESLVKGGYHFKTETDTEIIPHYFDMQLKKGSDMHSAIHCFMNDVKGTFAILLLHKGDDAMYAVKRDSPLALGIAKDKFFLASDIYAFSDETTKAIFFEDDEYAVVSADRFSFYNQDGKELKKDVITFKWTQKEETKENYPHYMIKEIKEQPEASMRLINSFDSIQKDRIEKIVRMIKNAKRVVFVACGTSYHASLVGSILLGRLGIFAQSIIASELESFVRFDPDTLCIAVSQSGETMDVLCVLKQAKKAGAKIVSIVNVPFSTVQRLSDVSLEILAGQEICVASTKAFTNQVIVMLELARRLCFGNANLSSHANPFAHDNLSNIPEKIMRTIKGNEAIVKRLAEELYKKKDIFVLGRGMSYPMAREIALKFKEIDYIHAEGMMAGELKHGTIALIEKGVPVISLIPNGHTDMISSTKEVEARGARTIVISNMKDAGELTVPECNDAEFAIYSGIIGHLLSYHIGVLKGCEIDKPRNLAKSVTVK